MIKEQERGAGTVNLAFNALRLLYGDLDRKPFVIDSLPRPKSEKKLPDVLHDAE